MAMAVPFVRFGRFAFDPAAGELWRDDQRVKLAEQPRLVLVFLMKRRGELVTREELCEFLWSADTHVDYEHGLNAIIKRLRDVLGDSAEEPRFIETVHKRGYRFVGKLESPADVSAGVPVEAAPVLSDGVESPIDSPLPREGSVRPAVRSFKPALILTGLVIAVASTAAVVVGLRNVPATAGEPKPVPALLTQVTFDRGLTTHPALSPDGHMMAYASDRAGAGDLDIWSQLDGGAPVRLTSDPADEDEASFTPDGNRLVFRAEREGGGIYVMGAHSGGQPQRLAVGGHNPHVSPDGRFVAYWTSGGDTNGCYGGTRVFVVPIEGGPPRQILPQFQAACWPVWAPDSRHLLVTAQARPDADATWFVAPIDGGAPVDTHFTLSERYHFAHLPQQQLWLDTTLIFSVWRKSPKNLWATHIDPVTLQTSDVAEQLTTMTEDVSAASAARTGKVAFSALTHKLPQWSLALDAEHGSAEGVLERVTDGVEYDRYPTISSDGASLCFARSGPKGNAVWARSASTGRERMLVAGDDSIGLPVISPDGSRIAYDRGDGDTRVIDVIRTDGGEPERVLSGCEPCFVTAWAHDNRQLLFSHNEGDRGFEIRALDLTTGRVHVVAGAAGHNLFNASLSNDGHWVLFNDVVGDRSRIVVAPVPAGEMRADQASWIPVTGGRLDDKPRWSPSESIVYFVSDRDGSRCVWGQRLDRRTHRPSGEPFAVYHAHAASVSLRNLLSHNLNLAVARDRLVFNASIETANIWTMPLDAAR